MASLVFLDWNFQGNKQQSKETGAGGTKPGVRNKSLSSGKFWHWSGFQAMGQPPALQGLSHGHHSSGSEPPLLHPSRHFHSL